MNGRFIIWFRRRQNLYQGNNVAIQCDPATGFANYIPGNVDNTTPWDGITPVAGWYDFTDYIDGAENIQMSWDRNNTGGSSSSAVTQDGSNYDKGISTDLMIFDKGHAFIFDWLLSTECSILNCVEVKIEDKIAGAVYRIFEIKGDNLEYMPVDEPCQFHIRLREQDNNWHCVHKNFIWDDFQNWFDASTVKAHPCFMTCIEPRPRILASARLALTVFYQASPVIALVNVFIKIADLLHDARKVLNADRFVDSPFVHTYIENIAKRCNLAMDTIFDVGREWEHLCVFYPLGGFMHESVEDAAVSPALYYHIDNRWMVTLAEFLDKLKVVFCAEWYVTPFNTIQFKYIKDLINLDPIYDYTASGAEPIYNLKYQFNGVKKPAYGRYDYTDDGSDLASQEMSTLYNDIVDYDGPAMNPMLEGDRSKTFEFAPTGFIRDGRAIDYLRGTVDDAEIGAFILLGIILVFIIVLAAGYFTLIAWAVLLVMTGIHAALIASKHDQLMNEFVRSPKYTGAVRITAEQTLAPRLLLWDGISMDRAKVVASTGFPTANPYFNPTNIAYDVANEINQNGSNPNKTIYNYPLYFDSMYNGNLYPLYHDPIDNPLRSLETNQEVTFDVDLCEAQLNLYGVFENEYAQIGKVIKVEHRENYEVYARITNIGVNYGDGKITIKGVVIRRRDLSKFPPILPPVYGSGGTIPTGPPPLGSSVTGEIPGVPPPFTPPVDQSPGTLFCIVWENQSGVGKFVSYKLTDGSVQTTFINAGAQFEAAMVIDTGDIAGIVPIKLCAPTGSATPGTSGSSSTSGGCFTYTNFGTQDATGVSYVDCNGIEVLNVTVKHLEFFCASAIISFGQCGNIMKSGECTPCPPQSSTTTPTCYIVDADYTILTDANGDRLVWCADPTLL